MAEAIHLSPEYGVIADPHGRGVVWYQLVDEWAPVTEPYLTGGEMTRHVKTGRRTYEAHPLGSNKVLDLTPELRAEINADLAKRGIEL